VGVDADVAATTTTGPAATMTERSRSLPVVTIAGAVFCLLLIYLALQIRAGNDPSIGAGKQAATAAAPRQVIVRRIIERRVIEEDAPAGASSNGSGAAAAASADSQPTASSAAPAAAAAPAPGPAPAPVVSAAS
jgi:hypothetical protein